MNNWQLMMVATCVVVLSACMPASAGDSAAGQKIFAGGCAACHQLKSYGAKTEAELAGELKGIVAGTTKHPKKLTLNDADIANVAAYISQNEPK